MSLPGGGLAVGGGGVGLVGLAIYLVVALLSGGGARQLDNLDSLTVASQPPSSALGSECHSGADANAREDCRIVGYVNSIQEYWAAEFQRTAASTAPKTVFFKATKTGCGAASSDVGPFYCPGDKTSTSTSASSTSSSRSAPGRPVAEAYVLAHEYGHHVRTCSGTSGAGPARPGPRAAPCAPSSRPTATPASGRITPRDRLPRPISPTRTSPTASTPRRDRRRPHPGAPQGRVNPETWTHGSSAAPAMVHQRLQGRRSVE